MVYNINNLYLGDKIAIGISKWPDRESFVRVPLVTFSRKGQLESDFRFRGECGRRWRCGVAESGGAREQSDWKPKARRRPRVIFRKSLVRNTQSIHTLQITHREYLQIDLLYPKTYQMESQKYNAENNPFSIASIMKSSPKRDQNDSGYSAVSDSGSESGGTEFINVSLGPALHVANM